MVARIVKSVVIGLLLLPVAAMAAESIQVVGLFGSKAVLEIDGQRRVVKAGDTTPEGVKLLSVEESAAVVEFDGKKERIELGSHISGTFTPAATREERYWSDNSGLYRANGTINGQPVSFLIDTGANQMAMNSGLAKRLGIDYKRGEKGMAATASDVVAVHQVMLDTVQVGSILQRQVSAVVIEGDQPQEVLLGMSFLSRLDMQREGQMMVLKQKW